MVLPITSQPRDLQVNGQSRGAGSCVRGFERFPLSPQRFSLGVQTAPCFRAQTGSCLRAQTGSCFRSQTGPLAPQRFASGVARTAASGGARTGLLRVPQRNSSGAPEGFLWDPRGIPLGLQSIVFTRKSAPLGPPLRAPALAPPELSSGGPEQFLWGSQRNSSGAPEEFLWGIQRRPVRAPPEGAVWGTPEENLWSARGKALAPQTQKALERQRNSSGRSDF